MYEGKLIEIEIEFDWFEHLFCSECGSNCPLNVYFFSIYKSINMALNCVSGCQCVCLV